MAVGALPGPGGPPGWPGRAGASPRDGEGSGVVAAAGAGVAPATVGGPAAWPRPPSAGAPGPTWPSWPPPGPMPSAGNTRGATSQPPITTATSTTSAPAAAPRSIARRWRALEVCGSAARFRDAVDSSVDGRSRRWSAPDGNGSSTDDHSSEMSAAGCGAAGLSPIG
ncbi:hypothetical protein [Pilimelia columellifera]|uniref:hypothetical protein n=1 Tax=Pilimelia columellifera TaxID=706574 RepID=UPI0031DD0144